VSSFVQNKAWRPQALRQSTISRSASQRSMVLRPKPSLTLNRISSLDTFIQYREDKADWRRESLNVQSMVLESPDQDHCAGGRGEQDLATTSECSSMTEVALEDHLGRRNDATAPSIKDMPIRAEDEIAQETSMPANKFRHISAEVGFCFTIAMTQFLAEYLITGFAIELPRMVARIGVEDGAGSMGSFWPASLLSLILSATLLIFARISDMYCGYPPFMFGVTWLFIWTSVAGFANSLTLLDIARAMQGLAIAAFIPSTFAMIGGIYSDGPRKNFVLGLYAGFAPLGFFGGFLAAGALPEDSPGWYFWIAAAISFITVITAYLTVPRDGADREAMDLKMDWLGSILITGGLILVAYALAVEPYAGELDSSRSGWTYPMVLGPLISGMFALGAAVYVEGWVATCPLLPFSFFKPRSVKAFSFACLCFYASYGVWLYESAKVFQSPFATGKENGVQGVTLALWYVPTALGGLALCVVGGALLHIVPILMLLLISAVAWIGAPLLLALCPLPMNYWAFVMPSMLCATAGIDLTFTISVVFLSAVQPLKHQGLAGAVSSILVNLAMSFSLSISEIVSIKAQSTITMPDAASHQWTSAALRRAHRGSQAALIYAAASAGLGLVVSILFVRISRSRVNTKPADEEQPKEKSSRPVSSEAPTLTGVF
jgi:MFS family permease